MHLMRRIVWILFYIAFVIAESDHDAKWQNFKSRFEKEYKHIQEEMNRRNIYKSNSKLIHEKNHEATQGRLSYTLAENRFSDMTDHERRKLNTLRAPFYAFFWSNGRPNKNTPLLGAISVPDAVDLRNDPCLAAIKDQGNCGSCYSFAAVVVVEYQACKHYLENNLKTFSEQRVIDCSSKFDSHGCNGGFYDNVWRYMKQRDAQPASRFPYKGRVTRCTKKMMTGDVKVDQIVNMYSHEQKKLATWNHRGLIRSLEADLPSLSGERD